MRRTLPGRRRTRSGRAAACPPAPTSAAPSITVSAWKVSARGVQATGRSPPAISSRVKYGQATSSARSPAASTGAGRTGAAADGSATANDFSMCRHAARRRRAVPVEDAIGDVRGLLHLVDQQARPQRVDGARRHEDRVAGPHVTVLHEVQDRAAADRVGQRLRGGTGTHAGDELPRRRGVQHVPRLGLAEVTRPLQPHRRLIVGVHLQRQPLGAIQDLDQQRESGCRCAPRSASPSKPTGSWPPPRPGCARRSHRRRAARRRCDRLRRPPTPRP